ncbi:MAG: OmpH family outer membrane protein [Mariprofundales bacterium]|nr:OmpH family outer membrane protein [Mariprofundales bacterium]
MKKSILAAVVAMAAGVFSMTAAAAELKVAYVDVKSAVENTQGYQHGIKGLEALKRKKEKALARLRLRIEKGQKDLLGQSMAMSQERLSSKRGDLKEMRKNFAREQQDAQEELINKKNKLDQRILMRFTKVVRAYGKAAHFDMILPKSSTIYFAPSHDVTAAITKRLDAAKTTK